MHGFDPKSLRESAFLTQIQVAELLGLNQSQVSRFENNPGEMSSLVRDKWCEICLPTRDALNAGIRLVEKYVETVDLPEKPAALPKQFPFIDDLVHQAKELARKPRIGIVGHFDTGKSRLINTLIGQDVLPTGHQPETSLICMVRHNSDRPDWMNEDPEAMNRNVFVMKAEARVESDRKRFDFDDLDNKDGFQSFLCMSGGLDVLKDFGTHSGRGAVDAVNRNMFAALVYVDAPILTNCDILDFPGYSNSDEDSQKAEFAKKKRMLDILVYTSQTSPFMNSSDFVFLNEHLRKIPSVETEEDGPLRNLFVVATRSDRIPSTEFDKILDTGAERTYDALRDSLNNLREDGVSQDSFRKRFFTFDAEKSEFRDKFEKDLSELIENLYPSLQRNLVDHVFVEARGKDIVKIEGYYHHISGLLKDAASKTKALRSLEKSEPRRKAKRDRKAKKIRLKIQSSKEETRAFINKDLKERCSAQAIEDLIDDKGYTKKRAQQDCGIYLLNGLQSDLEQFISAKSRKLAKDIDQYHHAFNHNESALSVDSLFDSRAAFIAGLTGAGTYGALSVWAATVAAGSNLGGYILTAKAVSALSAMGISVGGTAAANAAIAAIGGPITVIAALAISVAALTWAIFGKSWQERLASSLAKEISKTGLLKEFSDGVGEYWDSTRNAFDFASDATEKEYREHMGMLRKQIDEMDRQSLEEQEKYIAAVRKLFKGIPWDQTQPNFGTFFSKSGEYYRFAISKGVILWTWARGFFKDVR